MKATNTPTVKAIFSCENTSMISVRNLNGSVEIEMSYLAKTDLSAGFCFSEMETMLLELPVLELSPVPVLLAQSVLQEPVFRQSWC